MMELIELNEHDLEAVAAGKDVDNLPPSRGSGGGS